MEVLGQIVTTNSKKVTAGKTIVDYDFFDELESYPDSKEVDKMYTSIENSDAIQISMYTDPDEIGELVEWINGRKPGDVVVLKSGEENIVLMDKKLYTKIKNTIKNRN